MISQMIREEETVNRIALVETDTSVLDGIARAADRLRERAVLLNADGWQSGPITDPRMWESLHDLTVHVEVAMILTKDEPRTDE